jgi:membrane protease YdiL (CAAX protease family)
LILAIYLLLQALINTVFGVAPTEFLESVSGSKNLWLSLMLITLAPVLEELLFRGYLFKAWRHSSLGLTGTLLLTSVLFVGLHWGQYHWTLLAFLFLFSIILGLAREKSGSIWVPVILHAVNNLFCVVFLVYLGELQ